MTQYVMFKSTLEVEKAIEDGSIVDLTPCKVYELVRTHPNEQLVDDSGSRLPVVTSDWGFNCPHLNDLTQWQYCDADGNLL